MHPYDPRDPYPYATTGPVGRVTLPDRLPERARLSFKPEEDGRSLRTADASFREEWLEKFTAQVVAPAVAAERARIRQLALDMAATREYYENGGGERALRDFAALLEES